MATRILIVDDDPVVLKVLGNVLGKEGYESVCAHSGEEALETLRNDTFDLMITDLRLGSGMEGVELLYQAGQMNAAVTTIMITGHATVDAATQAMKEGAFDFITKPFKVSTILETVANALHHQMLCGESFSAMPTDVALHYGSLVGESAAMQDVYRRIERVAISDATVLVEGEAGSGKEHVATVIHEQSPRCEGPFLALDCSQYGAAELDEALVGEAGAERNAGRGNRGAISQARGGTLLLKNIQAMDLNLQAKLLQVLEKRRYKPARGAKAEPVDLRLIAVSSESLESSREAGRFREDLFYRIASLPVRLPPLRHHDEDIPSLVHHFCRQYAEDGEITVAPATMKALVAYGWPGNVAELEKTIACAAAVCRAGRITLEDLPPGVRRAMGEVRPEPAAAIPAVAGRGRSFRDYLRSMEREYLQKVLQKQGGDYTAAADLLGVSRASLAKRLGSEPPPESA